MLTATPPDPAALLPTIQGLVRLHFRTVPDHIASPEDLVQIAMIAVLKAAQRWNPDGGASFKNYACTRAHGAIRDYLRKAAFGGRHHHADVQLVSLDAPIDNESGATLADLVADTYEPGDPFLAEAINEAIASLPLDVQSALALVIEEDLTLREIGDMMGVHESRVCQWITRARHAIAAHPGCRDMVPTPQLELEAA